MINSAVACLRRRSVSGRPGGATVRRTHLHHWIDPQAPL